VTTQNNDGKWNPSGGSFSFVLLPPVSQTPLAYTFYAILTLIILWLVFALRTRALVRGQQELTHIVAERTAQLEAEKTALDTARRELRDRATYDSLTNLLNRGTVLESLQHEVSRSIRDNTPLGVVIADLDHFKRINDTHGHLCGDQVIREAADRFRAALRSYDLAGRYGGEEFLFVLPGWDSHQAPERTNRLLDAIRQCPFEVAGTELHLTCSVGAATFRPDMDSPDILEVLRRADDALYRSKNAGRNRATIDNAEPSSQFEHDR
jgi:diguanylate cyclase (GGDEF)-like protein